MSGGYSLDRYTNFIERDNLLMHTQNIQSRKVKKTAGFTLIELIVVVVIIGIISVVGIPGMLSLLGNVSQTASADKLLNSLAYARGEAVARVENIAVTTLPGADIGWNVFIDTDNDCVQDNGEVVLRVVDITADSVTIGTGCVGFNALGERSSGPDTITIDSGTATIPDTVITIAPSGTARIN